MEDPGEGNSVCDLTLIMRTRLLFGLYNKRTVPPHWQGFAKAYCVTIFLALLTLIFTYFILYRPEPIWYFYLLPFLGQQFLSMFVSLWTGDEYIYQFYSQNRVTDVTLDSPSVFKYWSKQINKKIIATVVLYGMAYGLMIKFQSEQKNTSIFFGEFLTVVLEQFLTCSSTTKLLVMGLFNNRIVILKRRLERYGFRNIGRAPPQPYCQIYDEILRGLDATNNPLKFMLFFDLIVSCALVIGDIYYVVNELQTGVVEDGLKLFLLLLNFTIIIWNRATFAFGHVALLESAAAHCDDMAAFIVVQLVKTPTEEERERMYSFLRALERRGARYFVLRALPLDARFLLQVLGFCSAQAIVLMNMLQFNYK